MVLAQKQKYRPRNKIESPEINPIVTLSLTKELRIHNGKKTASAVSGAGKRTAMCKRM